MNQTELWFDQATLKMLEELYEMLPRLHGSSLSSVLYWTEGEMRLTYFGEINGWRFGLP